MFKLNREGFNKFQKEFIKTYAGRRLLISELLFGLVFVIFGLIICFSYKSLFETDPFMFLLCLIGAIGMFFYDAIYEKELALFINEQTSSKNSKK